MQKKEESFEQKRLELEAWLQRMESRLASMAAVGHTADVLEVQLREQKGLHAELHQFKAQIEAFNQLTQRLITAHQHEDTSRYKKVPILTTHPINKNQISDSRVHKPALHQTGRLCDKPGQIAPLGSKLSAKS